MQDAAYQPLRKYVEEILITEDWAEVLIAENLTLDYGNWPGDYLWGLILSDPRETPEETMSNAEIIGEWVNKWYPKAYEAFSSLSPIFEKHSLPIDLSASLKKIEEEIVILTFKKYNVTFKIHELI